MQNIEDKPPFIKVNISILTVSDTRTLENDKSGSYLKKSIIDAGHECTFRGIVKDNVDQILNFLKKWVNDKKVDAIIITGGTGITGRDVTPEAIDKIKDK